MNKGYLISDIAWAIYSHCCSMCGESVEDADFHTPEHRKEYGLNGKCQNCQDLLLDLLP